MSVQGELFASKIAVAPGFSLVTDVVDKDLAGELATLIDAAPLAPFQFGPWQGKRLTYHYGRSYDFARHRLGDAPPLPDWLMSLRARLAPQIGMLPGEFAAALLIRYDPGAGIGWHRDRPQYGDVMGLSLGGPVTLRLRRRIEDRFERRQVLLPSRSLYHLSGEVRWEWEHSIAPAETTRRSITFRTLRTLADKG